MEPLIDKYINNELSKEEWSQLRTWLDQNPSNKTKFNHLISHAANTNLEVEELEEITWQELKTRRGIPAYSRSGASGWISFYKVAATVLIVATLALVAYQLVYSGENEEKIAIALVERSAPIGSKLTTRLPDESIVTLNAGSKITFPEHFYGNTRDVTLSGEAFFEVEHDPNKPFYVTMNGDKVRVLGTSFNIRSYPEDNIVCVSVATGRVSYTTPSGEEVELVPDQMATYISTSQKLLTGEVDKLQAFGWKDRILYFKGASFSEIIKELDRWYGVEIETDSDFSENGTYSSEFKNASLFEVINSLSFVYRFDFKIDGNKVIIRKK